MKTEVQVTAEELIALRFKTDMSCEFPISVFPLIGNGYSRLTGSGDDLYGVREYQAGDSCKRINRQATARTGVIHMNEYLEERMLSAYILIDQSTPLFFTSTHTMKSVIVARAGVEILFRYLRGGHRVSGDVFNESTHSTLPLTTSRATSEEWVAQVAQYNQQLLDNRLRNDKTALTDALTRSLEAEVTGREMYVISDFMIYDTPLLQDLLLALCHRNRICMIQLTDKLEETPPLRQWLTDGKNEFILHSDNERAEYTKIRTAKTQQITRFARDNDITYTEIFT